MSLEIPYQPLALDQSDVRYLHGPDSLGRAGVEEGVTSEFEWSASDVYPGTVRKFWVHVPARYDPNAAANVAVFLDGWWYLDPEAEVRAAIVLDNLVDRLEIPATIGVFVDPGMFSGASEPKNRNVEYDVFDDRHATFLLREILPQVSSRWSISDRPSDRLICGGSSGGVCAFTVGWLHPDAFGHVIACNTSFPQIPGGDPYPELLLTEPHKPLKVLMHVGHRDLGYNQRQGNWLAENLRVAAALAQGGYDFRLVLGDGGHSPNHAGVLLPDALRWHWGSPAHSGPGV
jgi:enterochelin esterase family protein